MPGLRVDPLRRPIPLLPHRGRPGIPRRLHQDPPQDTRLANRRLVRVEMGGIDLAAGLALQGVRQAIAVRAPDHLPFAAPMAPAFMARMDPGSPPWQRQAAGTDVRNFWLGTPLAGRRHFRKALSLAAEGDPRLSAVAIYLHRRLQPARVRECPCPDDRNARQGVRLGGDR